MRRRFIAIPLVLVVACGFPRPADVASDAPVSTGDSSGDTGSSANPGAIIQVSPSGDDANDGIAAPVRTLKHAIGLAAANTQIIQIALTAGTYSTSSGEIFPYMVPLNVAITGPAGGGAILSGGKASPGLTINDGRLQDLDLQDFTTAITVTGPATLKDVRVLTSTTAIQAETAGVLTVDTLSISGTPGACGTGIVLNGAAQLDLTTLDSRNLGRTLDAKDQSAIDISKATISQDLTCAQVLSAVRVVSSKHFHIKDSLLDGGSSGLELLANGSGFEILISNTIVRNMKSGALGGSFGAESTSFQMMGGELSSTASTAVQVGTGIWTFTGVAFRQNKDLALYIQGGRLVMRDCSVVNNGGGVDLGLDATGDLGTSSDPGNNTFKNSGVGLTLEGDNGSPVPATGNIWKPTQGADGDGKYVPGTMISGPGCVSGSNFCIPGNESVSL